MLIKITNFKDINKRKLMDAYKESNFENTDYFFPDEKDKEKAVIKVEEGFLDFLKNNFFKKEEATYYVLEENDIWVSALRVCKVKDLYYLEALETHPDYRKQGYGYKLLSSVIEDLKKNGSFRLCDCINKKNIPSIRTHEKCGFKIVAQEGHDYLNEDIGENNYSLEYKFIND